MNMYELLVLAVGLSMDAFAVAICKGLAIRTVSLKHAAWVGLWFGGFQMLMPLLGFPPSITGLPFSSWRSLGAI